MKNNILYLFICFIICMISVSSCRDDETIQSNNSDTSLLPIQIREVPSCDICDLVPQEHCCCFVMSNETTINLDIHICGVVGNFTPFGETCNMDGGDGCYDVSGPDGIHKILTPSKPIQQFCVLAGRPFSIYNANGSGHGHITVGCKGSGMFFNTVGLDLYYGDGSYTRHFDNTGCVPSPCDY